jgi:hypothetical protein
MTSGTPTVSLPSVASRRCGGSLVGPPPSPPPRAILSIAATPANLRVCFAVDYSAASLLASVDPPEGVLRCRGPTAGDHRPSSSFVAAATSPCRRLPPFSGASVGTPLPLLASSALVGAFRRVCSAGCLVLPRVPSAF